MATLLQSPPTPISLADVAVISRQLADDLSRLVLNTEGFSIEDYLSLDGPYFAEYVDGCLQVLPMPTAFHQAIAFVLANLLVAYSKSDALARTKLAPFRVRIDDREFREPDVCFMRGQNSSRRTNQFWIGADLVIEVISQSNRSHDYETKRREYAGAGIPEYWIVDPDAKTIHVLQLQQNAYVSAGEFRDSETAKSPLLNGFEVNVSHLFATAAEQA